MRRFTFPLPPVVGITGVAGSGKDTAAHALHKLLVEDGLRAVVASMAGPLKAGVGAMLRVDAFSTEFKTRKFGKMTGREILQHVGTEGLRAFDPDFHVMLMERYLGSLPQVDVAIIPDIRFANEAEMVRRRGGIVVRTAREGYADVPAHASEALDFEVDHYLDNTGPRSALAAAWLDLLTPVRSGALPPWGGAVERKA